MGIDVFEMIDVLVIGITDADIILATVRHRSFVVMIMKSRKEIGRRSRRT